MNIRYFLSKQVDYVKETLKSKAYCLIIALVAVLCGIITGIINSHAITEFCRVECCGFFICKISGTPDTFSIFFKSLFSSVFITLLLSCFCAVNKWSAVAQYVFLFIFSAGFTAGVCSVIKTVTAIGILIVFTVFLVYFSGVITIFAGIILYTRGDDYGNGKITVQKTVLLIVTSTALLAVICLLSATVYVTFFRPLFCFP